MSNPTFTPMPQVYQSLVIGRLEKENKRLRELVKTAFIEGHNVDYFKDLKRPVLSYWLESESHLALKETGNE